MPIHTVYVGAHEFDAETPGRLAKDARGFFSGTLGDPSELAALLGISGSLAEDVVLRAGARLHHPVIDDLRVDFEDGYAGDDEDADARRVARAAAKASRDAEFPAVFGLRIRSMADATASRSRQTLEIFLGSLLAALGSLPERFVVTLAKIDDPEEVTRLADALDVLESRYGLSRGDARVELMAETPRSVYDAEGRLAVPALVAAARGRCVGIHFGVYDFTASLGLVAGQQRLRHPVCDAARSALQIGLAGLDPSVELSDGSSRVVPRLDMGDGELAEAIRGVYADVRHSLDHGIYRGWDMAGSHVAIRRVAVTAFYLEALPEMRRRWEEAAEGPSDDLEDAATARAIRAFFERGRACGALWSDDLPSV